MLHSAEARIALYTHIACRRQTNFKSDENVGPTKYRKW